MNIMILDDNPVSTLTSSQIACEMGHRPVIVDSCYEAMKRLKAGDIQVVLLDWLMPDMDGLDLCRWIKAQFPNVYVIIQTANIGMIKLIQMHDHGADRNIAKGQGLGQLREAIRSACGSELSAEVTP